MRYKINHQQHKIYNDTINLLESKITKNTDSLTILCAFIFFNHLEDVDFTLRISQFKKLISWINKKWKHENISVNFAIKNELMVNKI